MIENQSINASAAKQTDGESWARLYERIRVIAHRKTAALIDGPEEDDGAFDRGARALRTLMSAAEIARRMKLQDEKDERPDDEDEKLPAFSDEDIRRLYRDVEARLDRIENETDADGQRDGAEGDAGAAARGSGGEMLGARGA